MVALIERDAWLRVRAYTDGTVQCVQCPRYSTVRRNLRRIAKEMTKHTLDMDEVGKAVTGEWFGTVLGRCWDGAGIVHRAI